MAEWKILAASFATLLVISTLLVGDFGIRDAFSGIVDKINNWLSGSPFGGMIEIPEGTAVKVDMFLNPKNFTFEPNNLNITANSVDFSGFSGKLDIDYSESKITMTQTGTGMKIETPINEIIVEGIVIPKITLADTKFSVMTEQSNISTQNDSVEINGFSGTAIINAQGIELLGNVSSIKGNGWEIK